MTYFFDRWRDAVVSVQSNIGQAIASLNDVSIKIVLVVDSSDLLIGTVTDGDVRRGLLRGLGLQNSISEVVNLNPVTVNVGMTDASIRHFMKANRVYQVPVLNDYGQVVGLQVSDFLQHSKDRENSFIIMAGGLGSRLYPHTENCPKPMLKLAGKPMLEHVILQARAEGFKNFVLAVNYLGHMIEDYFGEGGHLGVHITYLKESSPLGTAGALSLLHSQSELPFIVTNGDVISDIRYSELLDFHIINDAQATMGIRIHEWQHSFGVVEIDGLKIVGFEEKPVMKSYINAGVYALSPKVLEYIEADKRFDMPELFDLIRHDGGKTIAYPIHEAWIDVGRPDDYALAQNQFNQDSL